MDHVLPVKLLRRGEVGEVVDVVGNDRVVARLAENGLRKGCRLELLQTGDTLLFKVNDTKLSLRADVQVFVSVPAV